MKYCTNCGTACEDHLNYCTNCGMPFTDRQENTQNSYNYSENTQNTQNYNNNSQNTYYNNSPQFHGTYRSIPVCILLSIVTCGIYGIYWLIQLNDDINYLSGEPEASSGVMVVLFTLLTCGIYGLYWNYKMGERVDRIKGTYGNSGILYVVLAILELPIINYCLMQDCINKAI